MFIRCVGKEKSYKMLSGLCCFVIIYVHLSDNHVKAFNETYIQVKYHISIAVVFLFLSVAQINTDRVMNIGRNALYFEDYILSMQYFNQVIKVKPYMAEPYFYRGVAKLSLDDFKGAEEDCTFVSNVILLLSMPIKCEDCPTESWGLSRRYRRLYRGFALCPEDRSF